MPDTLSVESLEKACKTSAPRSYPTAPAERAYRQYTVTMSYVLYGSISQIVHIVAADSEWSAIDMARQLTIGSQPHAAVVVPMAISAGAQDPAF